jgi:DNA gyrase subunit A
MGRTAAGVRGIRLGKGDKVIGAVNLQRKGTSILVATQKGFGKRSEEDEYRTSHRGGKGIFTVKTSDKTGKMVAIKEVVDIDDVVIVTSDGMVIRQHASDIRVAGRNTQGVRLIRLNEGDTVAAVAAVVAEEEEDKQLAEKENPLPKEKVAPPVKADDGGKGNLKQENLFASKSGKTEKKKLIPLKKSEKEKPILSKKSEKKKKGPRK